MTAITILQLPVFKRAYKKLHANQKIAVNLAIKTITDNPEAGEEKKGNLLGILLYGTPHPTGAIRTPKRQIRESPDSAHTASGLITPAPDPPEKSATS